VLSRWPIRNKLLIGITLLMVIVVTLSVSGFRGVYAYRGLLKSLRARADELPLANALLQQVSDMRAMAASVPAQRFSDTLRGVDLDLGVLDEQFKPHFEAAVRTFTQYYSSLQADEGDDRIGDIRQEEQLALEILAAFDRIAVLTGGAEWGTNQVNKDALGVELAQLQTLVAKLPSHLHRRLSVLAGEVRTQYRSLIALLSITALSAAGLLVVLIHLFYRWVFRPLRVLVKGSRRVAAGDFTHRIELAGHDEMTELADAMNDMTARFRAIRDDLDRQVQIRTKQVVRSEQLASVGFLAAGVAHEINNPLASIAMCAESLEGRLAEVTEKLNRADDGNLQTIGAQLDGELAVMQRYLRMIQSESFRCKGITEKLLDFSRIGEVKRQDADLREIVAAVVEMVRHVGKYQDRTIVLTDDEPASGAGSTVGVKPTSPSSARLVAPIVAHVNTAEIKQVVLNLITNALDSLDSGGTLRIELAAFGDRAELVFSDNGCGMTEEVLAHLFEPFFTRRRGGQGTGLGLSIVYRIVSDHGGQIEAESDGPGRGSRFRVTLPLVQPKKETRHRYQAA
jgi:two-component system NtrC family sensor kinase